MTRPPILQILFFTILVTQSVIDGTAGFQPFLATQIQSSNKSPVSLSFPRSVSLHVSDPNNDENNANRSEGLRKTLTSLGEVADGTELRVGSTVVIGNSIPNLALWQFQSYELTSIYDQGLDEETGAVQKISRTSLQEPVDPPTFTRYIALYSEKHHGKEGQPVVVSPNEVELSSMQEEVVDSVIMALPLFAFWTALAFSFASQYSERTGGSFVDAMFGR